MKKILLIITTFVITINLWGQEDNPFAKYLNKDSLIYFNYETVNSKPFHVLLNKEQTKLLLNIGNVLDSLIIKGNPKGVASSTQILYIFSNLQNFKYNAPTSKKNEMQVKVTIENYLPARISIYVDNEYSTYIDYSLPASAIAKIKKEIEAKKPIVKPEAEVSMFPYCSMKLTYHNDSTITFKFTETWTQASKIVREKSYWSIDYTIDSIPEFIALLSKWKENFNKLKENKITTPVEKHVGTMFGLDIVFEYDYNNELYYGTEDNKYSGYITFNNVDRTYFDGHEDKYEFELLNIKGVDALIEALTTGKDKYYQQLKAYNEKVLSDEKTVNELLK